MLITNWFRKSSLNFSFGQKVMRNASFMLCEEIVKKYVSYNFQEPGVKVKDSKVQIYNDVKP